MSREVRRVPMGYQHPSVFNPRWENHKTWRSERGTIDPTPEETGIPEDYHFEPLFDGNHYSDRSEEYKISIAQVENKSGAHWEDNLWHLEEGLSIRKEGCNEYFHWIDTDEDLQEALLYNLNWLLENDKENYTPIPVVDADTDGFGYALYETVSEGTPVTSVFASAEELVDYLVEHGAWYGQKYSRANAEALVGQGYSIGSFAVVNGKMYDASLQASELNEALDSAE